MSRGNIPDLRDDHDSISLDHCYVLINLLAITFDTMEGTKGAYNDITEDLDPEVMREHLQLYFEVPEFSRLFKTDWGKGVLVGTFAKDLLDTIKGDPNEQV